jgi:hypothetical protein
VLEPAPQLDQLLVFVEFVRLRARRAAKERLPVDEGEDDLVPRRNVPLQEDPEDTADVGREP